jgi:two-component system KDP operon response regulator KdpE
MSGAAQILIVEDEESISRMLRSTLIQAGYRVITAMTGQDALHELSLQRFSVVLLDLGLPDVDGKEIIGAARRFTQAPFIVISARASEKEKVAALDMGASDFIAKPFDTGELLARIRVALRPPLNIESTEPKSRGLTFDARARRVAVDGTFVRLSQKETEFLQLMSDAMGAIVSHEQIKAAIWGEFDADMMNVRVLAWQVRRKIEPNPSAPRFLIAEAGVGYRLNLD